MRDKNQEKKWREGKRQKKSEEKGEWKPRKKRERERKREKQNLFFEEEKRFEKAKIRKSTERKVKE